MATTVTTDDKLIKMVRDAGHRYGPAILATSKGKLPFALALALVEQESGFRNIFGCDQGAPFCHQPVTRDRVQALIRHVHAGGISNGVGLTQITSIGFIEDAEHNHRGAHRVRAQCQVGFGHLHDLIKRHGERTGIGAYNGGEGNPIFAFADSVLAFRDKWQARINDVLL